MAELLPCPFCGKEATIQELKIGPHYVRKDKYRVKCAHCPCSFAFMFFKTREEAVKAWNTRKGGAE